MVEVNDWINMYSDKNQQELYFKDLGVPITETDDVNNDEMGMIAGYQPHDSDSLNHHQHEFLQQLEESIYDVAPGKNNEISASVSEGQTPESGAQTRPFSTEGQYELGMVNLEFMLPEDVNFGAGDGINSRAFPPTSVPPDTPNMKGNAATKDLRSGQTSQVFASPILPGQNEKSYNNQHYYHKHNRYRKSAEMEHNSDSQHVSTEAVFTPLVSPAVTPLDSQVNTNHYNYNAPIQASFEPLTSPALDAQNGGVGRRRSSSSMFAPADDSGQVHKRRTPHGTPKIQASNGKIKNSPSISGKTLRSSSVQTFEPLPESGVGVKSGSSTPMLPPNGKKVDVNRKGANAGMMGFTMGKLAAHQSKGSNDDSDFQSMADENGNEEASYSKSSSSNETSPVLSGQRPAKKGSKLATKKASHKLAEQGRRNRMNTAVHELGGMIPKHYHEQVAIPSKATTVELASRYIRDLVEELEELKNR